MHFFFVQVTPSLSELLFSSLSHFFIIHCCASRKTIFSHTSRGCVPELEMTFDVCPNVLRDRVREDNCSIAVRS